MLPNTYTVEFTMRMGTLQPIRNLRIYEVRGGNVLEMGGTSGPLSDARWNTAFRHIQAPIVLKANLTKGMHWKEGPKDGMRDCEVLDFVTVKVPAGEYKNVAKVGVKETYIDPETRLVVTDSVDGLKWG